jgi:hypothetical protein
MAVALLPLIAVGSAAQSASAATDAPATATATAPAVVHAVKPAPTLPPPTAQESGAGIQIARIASTASGGLVDVRFKVLDPVRAAALLSKPANEPMLLAGDKPPLMAPHHALKGSRFVKNQIFIILYPNTRGAVQPGTEVTVALGDLRLGPVTAQ